MKPAIHGSLAACALWLAACGTPTAPPPPELAPQAAAASGDASRPAPKASAPSDASKPAPAKPSPAPAKPAEAPSATPAPQPRAAPKAPIGTAQAPARPAPSAPAKAPAKAPPPAAAAAPAPPAVAAPAAPKAQAAAPLDLKSLEHRLKETDAIGVLTKLSLKNQVDDLITRFRAYHEGHRPPTLPELRPSFELLVMKVLSLLQDKDPRLAEDINRSRDALWGVLTDRQKLTQYN